MSALFGAGLFDAVLPVRKTATRGRKTRRVAAGKTAARAAAGLPRRKVVGPMTYVPAQLVPRPRGRPSKSRLAQRALAQELYVPRVGRPAAARKAKLAAHQRALRAAQRAYVREAMK